jgi:DNA polymerase-1
MRALIDADIVAYRVACTLQEDDSEDFAYARTEDLVDSILVATEATEYNLYLTGKNNFRYTIYPEYKAHRPKEKPFWLEKIRQYLIATFNAEVVDGQEADDAMGIEQAGTLALNEIYNNISPGEDIDGGHAYASDGIYFDKQEETVICSIDKDLLMIPGQHYNFVKDKFIYITEEEAIKNFYMQCLTGDRSDNIKGIEKIGPKKAEKILAGCKTEKEMFDAVREAYSNDEEFIMNARVLWIRQMDDEDWKERFDELIQE